MQTLFAATASLISGQVSFSYRYSVNARLCMIVSPWKRQNGVARTHDDTKGDIVRRPVPDEGVRPRVPGPRHRGLDANGDGLDRRRRGPEPGVPGHPTAPP